MDGPQLVALAAGTPVHGLDDVVKTAAGLLTCGRITVDEYEAALGIVELRRSGPPSKRSIFVRRLRQKPRDPSAVVERRRRVAASGSMPPALASKFTTAEAATLSIVAMQVRLHGRCTLPIDALAAMAGCSRSSVKNAIRRAAAAGLVHVQARPRCWAKSDTNVITITDATWRTWLRRSGPVALVGLRAEEANKGRGQNPARHEYPLDSLQRAEPVARLKPSFSRGRGDRIEAYGLGGE